MNPGLLYSRIREDEKLLLAELRERGHDVTFDVESALATVERFGYPCVVKPVTGSWGG